MVALFCLVFVLMLTDDLVIWLIVLLFWVVVVVCFDSCYFGCIVL